MNIGGNLILKGTQGLGSVWLSGAPFARDLPLLLQNNIKSILCLADLDISYPPQFNRMALIIDDLQSQPVSKYFPIAFQFLEQQRPKNNVLVHCAYGISRSSTIMIAYMMWKYGMKYEEAFKSVKEKRPQIAPNRGFEEELREYEKKLREVG